MAGGGRSDGVQEQRSCPPYADGSMERNRDNTDRALASLGTGRLAQDRVKAGRTVSLGHLGRGMVRAHRRTPLGAPTQGNRSGPRQHKEPGHHYDQSLPLGAGGRRRQPLLLYEGADEAGADHLPAAPDALLFRDRAIVTCLRAPDDGNRPTSVALPAISMER